MKLKLLLYLLLFPLLFSSCSHVYSPALYHQDIAYQPKPASFDTLKALTYASAGLNTYTNANLADLLVSGQLNVSRGYVFNNFNLAFGGFGVLGNYENGTIDKGQPNYFANKFFGAVGGRVSGNFFVRSGRADIRFLGFEAAYSHEFGSFANFRQAVFNQPNYYVDPRTDLFTIGLTTEVIFHNEGDNSFQHGIRGFLGTTLGHNDLEDNYYSDQTGTGKLSRAIFPKASYFISFKNYFGTFEVGSQLFLRFGLKF